MLHAEPSCLSWLICIGDTFRQDRAFSSEVGPGSRKENASKQEARAPFRFNRNGKALAASPGEIGAVCLAVKAWLAVKWLSSSAFILRFILDLTQTSISRNA